MDWGKLIENKIREAQDAGEFDRLPKTGQITGDDESSVPEDMRLAVHMLKSQGFAPDWIEQDKALRQLLTEVRHNVVRSWLWYRARMEQTTTAADRIAAEDDWKRARERFEKAIAQLNKDVFNHNLRVPSIQLQRLPLRLSEEYHSLGIRV